MGSKSSTRWKGYRARLLKEDCYELRAGAIAPALPRLPVGELCWSGVGVSGLLILRYRKVSETIGPAETCYQLTFQSYFEQCINLSSKPARVGGGVKWYAQCPNPACLKLVEALYKLPWPGDLGDGFFCRHCLNLAYSSNRKKLAEPKYTPLAPRRPYALRSLYS